VCLHIQQNSTNRWAGITEKLKTGIEAVVAADIMLSFLNDRVESAMALVGQAHTQMKQA
jgi:hypothetical protein